MVTNKKTNTKTTQIRLLLPKEWIAELDNLAASRFLTRLGLIRFYLRIGMNDDLAQLSNYFDEEEKRRLAYKLYQKRREDDM